MFHGDALRAVIVNFRPLSRLTTSDLSEGGAYGIVRLPGADWVKPHGGEQIPCRHLACIVVAAQPTRRVEIFCCHYVAHMLLGFHDCPEWLNIHAT